MLLADAWLTTEDWLGPLLAVVPVLYGSLFVHELGHALFGRLAGLRVTSFGLGLGRPFLAFGCGGMRVYLARKGLAYGATFLNPDTVTVPRGRLLLFLIGGIVAQLVLALLALAAWWLLPWGRGVWLMIAGLNALWGLANLLPLHLSSGGLSLRSDGALLLQVLRQETILTPAAQHVQFLLGLRELFVSIGDRVGLRARTLYAANAWLELGCPEEALRLCAEAATPPWADDPFGNALLALVRAEAERQTGELERATSDLGEAEQQFAARRYQGGLLLVVLVRAELPGGGAAEVVGRLRALAELPVLRREPTLLAEVCVACLTARADLPDEDLSALWGEYEGAGLPASLTHDVRFYRGLAGAAGRRGNVDLAARAFRRALAAVDRINDSWTTDREREAYQRGQAPLLAEARAFFTSQGLAAEVETVDGVFRPVTAPARTREDRRKSDVRAGHLLGAVMGIVEIVLGASFPSLVALVEGSPDEGARGLARHLVLVGVLVLFYESSTFLLRRMAPSWGLDGRGWAWVGPVLSALALPTWFLLVLAGLAPPPDHRSHGTNSVYHASEYSAKCPTSSVSSVATWNTTPSSSVGVRVTRNAINTGKPSSHTSVTHDDSRCAHTGRAWVTSGSSDHDRSWFT